MRALAITGIETASMISRMMRMDAMRATPPSLRMSAGTRSSAITAAAPACSAIFACSTFVTSMMTPPLSISASPVFNRNSSVRNIVVLLTFASQQDWLPLNQCRFFPPDAAARIAPCNLAEDGQPRANLLRLQAGEAEPQAVRLRPRNFKRPPRQKADAFLFCPARQFAGVQPIGQLHPHVHAAFRTGETAARGQFPLACLQTRL